MLHRRPTAAALVAMLLPLAAALTSCGFDNPTDRVNTIAGGVNNREASVEVLGARILAFGDGNGRLIGTFVNSVNDGDPATLTGIEVEGTEVAGVPSIEIPPNGYVNLADDGVDAIPVTGDFTAGDVVTVSYAFSTNEVVSADLPVVKACHQYADIADPGAEAPRAEGETEQPETEATEESDGTYLCDHATEHAEEEGGH